MAVEIKEFTPQKIVEMLENVEAEVKKAGIEREAAFKEVAASFADKKSVAELAETVTKSFVDAATKHQDLTLAVNDLKKQLDNPLYGDKGEYDDACRKAAIDHERTLFLATNTDRTAFFDEKKVDLKRYQVTGSAHKKLMLATDENSYRELHRKLSEDERKGLSMSQIDGHFLIPEVQQIIRDCFLEPVGLFDLYDTFNVGKMSFVYPFIKDHTNMGGYICSDDCGTIQAAGMNLQFRNEQVYDWRGTFCVTTKLLAEAAIDILAIMAREMALSKRMTSNQAWISGDGVNQPKGWLTANTFPIIDTSLAGSFNAADVRSFFYRVPPEFGNIQAVMHPNTLAVLMAMTNAYGEFLFGEGMLFAEPSSLDSKVRLSRYMPEINWTVTPGSNTTAAAITAPSGSLVAAAANWKKAYMVPTLMPMTMRQGFMIQGPWCAQYHFWAQDGGAPVCGEAGRVLQIR
jgi:HK97 family phage major capsid protein